MLRIITGSKAGRGKKRSKQKSSPDIYVKAVPARKEIRANNFNEVLVWRSEVFKKRLLGR